MTPQFSEFPAGLKLVLKESSSKWNEVLSGVPQIQTQYFSLKSWD